MTGYTMEPRGETLIFQRKLSPVLNGKLSKYLNKKYGKGYYTLRVMDHKECKRLCDWMMEI